MSYGMLILERFCDSDEMGTFGKLYFEGREVGYTVEKPWKDNQPFASCIPNGTYNLQKYSSGKYPDTYCLYSEEHKVYPRKKGEGRYAILFHSANVESELAGCIAPGTDLGFVYNKWAVLNSTQAMRDLKAILDSREQWQLHIVWKEHEPNWEE